MCQFKSGVILKNRCYIANEDHHSKMLEELKIEDNYLNATKTFVRAELIPSNSEWWSNPDTWTFIVDQDVCPEWFEDDRQKYEDEFRSAVREWWTTHVLIDQKIEELTSGYYRLKRCEVKKILNDVKVMCDSSTVQRMYDSSTVQRMYDSSTVQEMYGSSTVQRMYDSSTVQRMCDSSTVQRMYGSSIARAYNKGKILVSQEASLKAETFSNPKE